MNAEVQAPHEVASICSLACIVSAAEVEPLLEHQRTEHGARIKTLCVLDEPQGGDTLDDPSEQDDRAALEGLTDVDLILLTARTDVLTREVALALVEASLQSIPIRWASSFTKDPGTGREERTDLSAVRAVIDVLDAHADGRRLKRFVDVVFAAAGLLFALPLMLVIAAVIVFDSHGSPLYRQERLGQYRRPFSCMKFRTMRIDGAWPDGPMRTCEGDPRITRVGRFLRKSRLDELPQLLNVLKGDMSIVGPRPILSVFADELTAILPIYDVRFIEKPGLTGWAQVRLAYPQTIEEELTKLRYDFDYIRRRSFWTDLAIMARTVSVVARMKGL